MIIKKTLIIEKVSSNNGVNTFIWKDYHLYCDGIHLVTHIYSTKYSRMNGCDTSILDMTIIIVKILILQLLM